MILRRLAAGLALLAVSTALPAAAQDGQRNTPPARRTIQVDVFGTDPCPMGADGEIVVCARKPEAERYRIPPRLREQQKASERKEQSWVSRTRDIEETGRAERPDSCSPVGSGGQTGCNLQFMRDSAAQKRADAAAAADPDVP